MPLSGAERNRIYREKLKAKLGERHIKEQDAKRKAESRMKDVEKSREKERERQQRCRDRKRAAANAANTATLAESPAYKSASSFGKAVKRAQSHLPTSPRKRQKVVQKLVVKFLPLSRSMPDDSAKSVPHNKITEDDAKEVTAFYMRADISWMAPGKKDYITVIRDGKKVKEQKRFLLMSLQEAHKQFSIENMR
jgi:hypothetical protein